MTSPYSRQIVSYFFSTSSCVFRLQYKYNILILLPSLQKILNFRHVTKLRQHFFEKGTRLALSLWSLCWISSNFQFSSKEGTYSLLKERNGGCVHKTGNGFVGKHQRKSDNSHKELDLICNRLNVNGMLLNNSAEILHFLGFSKKNVTTVNRYFI